MKRNRGLLRQCCSLLLVTLILVAATGLPLAHRKTLNRSEMFPCMDCPCGCVSADVCWDSCCCHSDAEKMAWAKSHGVTPPEFLTRRVSEQETQQQKMICCIGGKRVLCAIVLPTKPVAKSCCGASGSTCGKSLRRSKVNRLPMSQGITLQAEMKCKGMSFVWNVLASAVQPVAAKPWTTMPMEVDRWGVFDVSGLSFDGDVDPPVPWHGFA